VDFAFRNVTLPDVDRRPRKLHRDGGNWGWTGELSADDRKQVGATTATLLDNGPEWIHRRVETLTFVDERVVRRHLSVDFTLPKWIKTSVRMPRGEEVLFVPVTLLERRDAAMNFDVRDEQGTALPLVTRREDTQLTGAALTELAVRALRRHHVRERLHPEIVAAIAFSTTRIYRDALPYIRSLISPMSSEWGVLSADSAPQRHTLRKDDTFCDFLGAFATSSLAFVPLVGAAGAHRILKLTLEEEVHISQSLMSLIGWSSTVLIAPLPLVGLAETYHVQLTPPENVEFTEAGIAARRPSEFIRTSVGENVASNIDTYRQFSGGPRRSVHLYQPRSHQIAGGTTWFAMRPERGGLLFGATAAALLITAMMTLFDLDTDAVVRQPSSASSLLLLAPGLVAAYLLRPGEHAMARRLLRAARLFLIVASATTFAAAAVLVSLYPETKPNGPPPTASDELQGALCGLAIGAAVSLVLLIVSLLFPRARKRDRGDTYTAPPT
jgi:hypothetical protein